PETRPGKNPTRGRKTLDAVKAPCVVAKNLFDQRSGRILARAHRRRELTLGRGIVMPVIRADEQMAVAGVAREIGHVLVGLAGDEEAVILEKIGAARIVLPFFLDQSAQDV